MGQAGLTDAFPLLLTALLLAVIHVAAAPGRKETLLFSAQRGMTPGHVITKYYNKFGNIRAVLDVRFMNRNMPVARTWLCNSSSSTPRRLCQCDFDCVLFGDCCVDAFERQYEIKNTSSSPDVTDDALHQCKEHQTLHLSTQYLLLFPSYRDCIRVYQNKSFHHFSMIAKCPATLSSSNPDLYSKCHGNKTLLQKNPVSFRIADPHHIVFKNVFCAACHGLNQDDVLWWKFVTRCPKHLTIARNTSARFLESEVQKHCTGNAFFPPKALGNPRRCVGTNDAAVCPSSNETSMDFRACHAYLAPVKFQNKNYRNAHCVYCDHPGMTRDPTAAGSFHNPSKGPGGGGGVDALGNQLFPGKQPQFNILKPIASFVPQMVPTAAPVTLFDFSFITGSASPFQRQLVLQDEHVCANDSVYDYIHGECKTIVCPPGRHLLNGTCSDKSNCDAIDDPRLLPSLDPGPGNQLFIQVRVHGSETQDKRLKEAMMRVLEPDPPDNQQESETSLTLIGTDTLQIPPHVISRITFELNTTQSLANVLYKFQQYVAYISGYYFKLRQIIISNIDEASNAFCGNDQPVITLTGLKMDIRNETVLMVAGNLNQTYNLEVSRFSVAVDPNTRAVNVDWALVCSHLHCPTVVLNSSEFSVTNDTLYVNASGETIEADEFELNNSTAFVCVSALNRFHPDLLLGYLYDDGTFKTTRYVVYSLSITGLVLTVLVYIKCGCTKTLHGRILVSMSLTLASAQLLQFLKGRAAGVLCQICAPLSHFSWVSAFMWMSIISYDMMRLFAIQPMKVSGLVDTKRFTRYAVTGWAVPLLFVAICFTLDKGVAAVDMRYGQDGHCFIGNSAFAFLLFIVPASVCVLFNIVAFAMTIFGINKGRVKRPHSSKDDKLFSFVYLKLSVIMGVAWAFAFLAALINKPTLLYIDIALNGLQGVFVFLIFGLRRLIRNTTKAEDTNGQSTATTSSKITQSFDSGTTCN